MLVMGAYGHSRWREFILGGATKSMLSQAAAPDPVFALRAEAVPARRPWRSNGRRHER